MTTHGFKPPHLAFEIASLLYGFNAKQMMQRTRNQRVVYCRWLTAYILRRYCYCHNIRIAELFDMTEATVRFAFISLDLLRKDPYRTANQQELCDNILKANKIIEKM